MRYYRSYMDRQEVSAECHDKLMGLSAPRRPSRRAWGRYGTLAACAALIVSLGAWRLVSDAGPALDSAPPDAPARTEPADSPQPDGAQPPAPPEGFVVSAPAQGDKLAFPMIPAIHYQAVDQIPEMAASRAFAPGSFLVDLSREDIQAIFWGPEGKPEADHPKLEQGDLPWMLFWDGYTVHGCAWYDGQGQLTELTLWGDKGRASFTLELRLGALPFTCCVELDRGDEISQFNGVEIAAWSRSYDRDGDGLTDAICGSEFMTPGDVGVRFQNVNSTMEAEYEGGTAGADRALDGACTFNALFVRQALSDDGGLHLDHLMAAETIPAWRYVTFDGLAQARTEAEFAPYLPREEPEGYAAYAGDKDFFGRLSYQEGREDMLFVRWSMGHDDIEVDVYRPEGDSTGAFVPVDIDVPASYDARLYDIPWCDSVPEEYRAGFYDVTFRAQDMSLEAVEAREISQDTGGTTFEFNVLHEDGVVVSYRCDGMSAQQVWAMVAATLSEG